MKFLNLKYIIFLIYLLGLMRLLTDCHKSTTCQLPNDDEIATMKAKWIHYNVGDTLLLISNYNDTNIFICENINSWAEEDKSNSYHDGICCYIYSTRFSSDFNEYNFLSYEFYKNGVGIFCQFDLKSNNSTFSFDNNYSDAIYMDSLKINNNTFTEVYKIHDFKDVDYDIFYSPAAGLIKLSIDNDSLYFMPTQYW